MIKKIKHTFNISFLTVMCCGLGFFYGWCFAFHYKYNPKYRAVDAHFEIDSTIEWASTYPEIKVMVEEAFVDGLFTEEEYADIKNRRNIIVIKNAIEELNQ